MSINKKINVGDYYQLKNKDYCVVLWITQSEIYPKKRIRFRVVKSCKGKHSTKKRIGHPYTYQLDSYVSNFKKRVLRKVSHEEVLKLLFKQQNHNLVKSRQLN